MMFVDCPAYLDHEGALRCGLPAEVRCRFTMRSSSGPLEAAMIRCPSGHWFTGPIEFLTWESTHEHQPGDATFASSATCRFRDGPDDAAPRRLTASSPSATARAGNIARRTCPDTTAGPARHPPGQPEPATSRPSTAPAYYLGRPARLWISAMTPRSRRTPLAAAQTQTGEHQPCPPAANAQPEPSQAIPQITPALRSA
jgi:hypothetical protein